MAKKPPKFKRPGAHRENNKGVKDAASFFKNNYRPEFFGARKDGLHLKTEDETIVLKRTQLPDVGPRVLVGGMGYRLVKYLKNDWHLAIGAYLNVDEKLCLGFVVLHTDAFGDENPIFVLSEDHLPVIIPQELKELDTPDYPESDYQTRKKNKPEAPHATVSFGGESVEADQKLDILAVVTDLKRLIAQLQALTETMEKSTT